MSPTTIKNDGAGDSPLAKLITHVNDLRPSAPVSEYLSNNGRVLLSLSNPGASSSYPTVGSKFGWSM